MPSIKIRRVDFYPDDWIAGTIGLNHDERSVYISICVAIWSHGGPVDKKYVKQICAEDRGRDRHFERGLEGLLAKGKVSVVGAGSAQKLSQTRAESELNRAKTRAESAQNNGQKGGRPLSHTNGLAKPEGFGPTRVTRPRDRAPSPPLRKKELTSSVGEAPARAHEPREAAPHAHDDENGAWRKVGNAVPLASTPPPPLFTTKAERAAQHWGFLFEHGASGEAERYYAAMMESGVDWPPDEIFDAVEARMVAA